MTKHLIENTAFNNLDYNEKTEKELVNKTITSTNGYIYFVKDTILNNLNPNHILSIEEVIEFAENKGKQILYIYGEYIS